MLKRHYTIPVFIPELACPFQCVYCNQAKISGHISVPEPGEINKIIERHLETIPSQNSIVEIGFFGGNFTGIDLQLQTEYLKVAKYFVEKGIVNSIRLSTRPDYINQDILCLLKKYHVKTIELGAQSTDDEVLIKSARGHQFEDTKIASELILEYGFTLGLQMMIGLPGDTLEKSLKTATDIINLGASETRIYPCLVINDTQLATWYKNETYSPLSLEIAVKWSTEIFLQFEKAGVKVIRLGLHPSEGLIGGKDLVAGPFHPSFRELVLSELWKGLLQHALSNTTDESITIIVHPSQINYAIGYNSSNRNLFNAGNKKLTFNTDTNLQGRDFRMVFN